MNINYYFGKTDGGDVSGTNDPTTANFAYEDNLVDTLVRESIQNIIDAKIPGVMPVKAEFDLVNITAQSLPNFDNLVQIFGKCAEYAEKRKVKRAVKHYKSQIDILIKNDSIPMLRIADYNTFGLTGDINDGRWFMFMRSVGFNAGDTGSGGAFGLGKGAFFANSLFKTIFVSSVTDKDVKFAGKLRLSSFVQDGELMQGNGTYGLPGQLPLQDKNVIPQIFNREKQGTDIWIVNFSGYDNWQENICRAVLSWFWPSIYWGLLVVRVGDQEFDSSNLQKKMKDFFSLDKRFKKPYNPLHFFEAYTNPDKKIEKISDYLGKISFYGKTSDDLPFPSRVALIRNNGMIIDFTGRGSALTNYAAVFECKTKEGGEILKKFENPSHTKWDKHNYKDDDDETAIEIGKNIYRELENFINGGLSELLDTSSSQSTIIPGLSEYVGVPAKEGVSSMFNKDTGSQIKEAVDEETGIEIGSEENEESNFPHTIKPIRVSRYARVKLPQSKHSISPRPSSAPRPYGMPQEPLDFDDNSQLAQLRELDNATVRCIIGDKKNNGRIYKIVIHTGIDNANLKVRVRLYARADNDADELLHFIDAVGENKTKIIKIDQDYCDFSLDCDGNAFLSVLLDEQTAIAIDSNFKILP